MPCVQCNEKRRRPDLGHLVLVGLFVPSDLPLQVLDVALQRADQTQQPLTLLLQLVGVRALVVDLPLETVELSERPGGDECKLCVLSEK